MKKIISSIFILLSIFIFTACSEVERYDILTTNFITYDVVRSIVGDSLKVGILTNVNQDYHEYEPTSKELLTIKQTNVFVMLGFEYETWLGNEETIKTYLNKDAVYFNLSEMVETEHDHHDDDTHDHHEGEHFWTNPILYVEVIKHLNEALSEIFLEFELSFLTNSLVYTSELEEVSNSFKTYLSNLLEPTIYFVGHNALQGFSEYFEIKINPLENKTNPHSDPTSEDVISFISKLKEKNIKIVFTEEFVDQTYLNFIKQEISDIEFLELHGYHKLTLEDFNQGITYLDLLKRNIENIKEVY